MMNRIQRAAAWARWITLLCLIVMFIGTHVPISGPPAVSSYDKLLHFLGYLILTFGVLASWELSTGPLLPMHYFVVWLTATLYAAADELTQIPVGRTCDGVDWLCDVVGVLAGLAIFRLLRPLIYRIVLGNEASPPVP